MTVSVVIPTYNATSFIRETLASVFAQTRRPAEVIVVDDCSRDDTVAVVEGLAVCAPVPVRVIRLPTNSGGPAHPLTVGFDAAAGDFVAPLDQDDVFLPYKIERQAEVLEARPEVNLVVAVPGFMAPQVGDRFGDLFASLARGAAGVAGVPRVTVHPGAEILAALMRHENFVIGFPGMTFRRSAWAGVRPIDGSLRVGADYDFLCRLCLSGAVALVGEVHYLRRDHSTNLSHLRMAMRLDIVRVRSRYLPLVDPLRYTEDGGRIRAQCYGAAYAARGAGNYRHAWECLRHVGRVWGWDYALALAAAKLAGHALRSAIRNSA